MRNFISLTMATLILLTSCFSPVVASAADSSEQGTFQWAESVPEFDGLNDPELLRYTKDAVYQSVVSALNSEEYFIENVDAIYISKEYLAELEYNGKENIYFGYTLSELEGEFQGKRFVFTLSDDGTTGVISLEEGEDADYHKVMKNVAIGAGVILVCVTVSVVSGGLGAPAISVIFAASAKTGAIFALSSGLLGGVAAGTVELIATGNTEKAISAAMVAGSEGFKWGAISGVISGGATEAVALKGATVKGLTMNQAAAIQKESGYPLDVIKNFSSPKQYEVCKQAGLTTKMVNGKTALVREIDLNFVDEKGLTNLERMQKGYAAIDPETGLSYELHHVGQQADSTLAILTKGEHMQGGNNSLWHEIGKTSEIDRGEFNVIRAEFWKAIAAGFSI